MVKISFDYCLVLIEQQNGDNDWVSVVGIPNNNVDTVFASMYLLHNNSCEEVAYFQLVRAINAETQINAKITELFPHSLSQQSTYGYLVWECESGKCNRFIMTYSSEANNWHLKSLQNSKEESCIPHTPHRSINETFNELHKKLEENG